jgi:hypothetical protein
MGSIVMHCVRVLHIPVPLQIWAPIAIGLDVSKGLQTD